MALKFSKKMGSKSDEPEKETTSTKPKLKYGSQAKKLVEQEEAKTAARQAQYGKAFRFRIPYEGNKTKEVVLTFLDGELDEDGMLNIPYVREHTLKVNGQWTNIICTEDEEGFCPICNDDDSPALVGYLTVLDHTPYKMKNGETREVTKKLLVAKKASLQVLTNQATKRKGLTGCTFEVQRTGDREPAIGNQYDFMQKDSLEELAKENGWPEELIEPLKYEDEVTYYTSAELLELGVGTPLSGPGTQKPLDDSDISDKM